MSDHDGPAASDRPRLPVDRHPTPQVDADAALPDDSPAGDPTASAAPTARTATAREAARLRWELARTRSRRSVRAALLATEVAGARHGGPRDVVATLRGERVRRDLDVIAPAQVRRDAPYPHLEIAHLSTAGPFAAAATHRRIDPADTAALRRQPPDVVVLDDLAALAAWPQGQRRDLASALRDAGTVIGLVRDAADAAEAARWPLARALIHPGAPSVAGVAQLPWLAGVDPAVDNPIGWSRTPARGPVVVVPAPPSSTTVRDAALDDGTTRAERAAGVALATDLGWSVVEDPAAARTAVAAAVARPATPWGRGTALALAARGVPVLVPANGDLPTELSGLVTAVPGDQLAEAAAALADDLDARERDSVRRRRTVLRQHDHRARLETLLADLGVPLRPPPRISVLLGTRRPDHLDDAVARIVGQDHPDVEVVAALHGDGFAPDAAQRIAAATDGTGQVVRVPAAAPLGDVLNAALDRASGTLVAKMDDDDLYGPGHLADLVVALRYSGADVVGRWANETHLTGADVTIAQDLDRQERWAHHLPGATMLVHGDVLRAVRFRRVPRHVDTHLLRSIHAAGGSAYATHRFGFVRRRHDDHTYEASASRFATDATARAGLDRSVLEI